MRRVATYGIDAFSMGGRFFCKFDVHFQPKQYDVGFLNHKMLYIAAIAV